ncbi:MAG: multidrug efflux SMR transporter [Betaproteobacteria bacterium]
MPWLYLLASGVFEIGFTTCMKFEGWLPLVLFVAFAAASFFMLTLAMRSLPLGTCYAVFTAIGAAGTALVGIVWFDEAATPLRLFFIGLIVAVVAGLKFAASNAPPA